MARLRIRLDETGRPNAALVVLSRRNLLALLHKLDMPGSLRTLTNSDVEIEGEYAEGFVFCLQAESDGEHYAKRPDAPGAMHPLTEGFIYDQGGWSARNN